MKAAGQAHPRGLVVAVHDLMLQQHRCRSSARSAAVARGHRDEGAAVRMQLHDVVVREPLQHLRTTDRPTLKISHKEASGSLVPGTRRWFITPSNTAW